MFHGYFDTSLKLTRSILRRDRMTILIWIVILVAFSIVLAPGMDVMFPGEEARLTVAQIYDNPLMVSMMGPIYGLGDADIFGMGAMYSGFMLIWVIIAVALMNIFFVVRHTRADEERGRAEVVRSLPVGRIANLNATMISAVIINAVLAVLTGAGIAVTGVEGMGWGGSMLYGVVIGMSGLIFAAITALFCQLSSSSGGASAMSGLTLGIFYMIRAVGDAQGNDFIACLSPLGLATRSQIYVNNYIWPTLVLLLLTAVISAAAYKLNTIRDLGQGFIAAKPGRAKAPRSLSSPFGLSWRLLRTALISWIIVMFALGGSYGSVMGDLPNFIGDSPEYLMLIGIPEEVLNIMSDADKAGIIVTYFGAFITVMMTLVSIVPILTAAMRPRTEEREGRAEHIIARVVPRWKYMCGYVALAFITSAVLQFAMASGLYLSTDAIVEINPFNFDELMQAYFSFLPAMWVMIGVAVFIVGVFPKAIGAIWGFFGFVVFVSFIGSALDLPEWLYSISPMHHVPRIPLEEFTIVPLIILTVIALVLTSVGFIFYNKRDTLNGI
ncbi:MAG: hypothetical protein FWF15_07095 [Oscillospiraceae bacterium]|nr:hypothetical protein [Oscillospiraceae bacterium]